MKKVVEHNVNETKEAIASKYDVSLEQDVLKWIGAVLGSPTMFAGVSGPDAVHHMLKDGVVLCNLMNKIKPGTIPKFQAKARMPFQMMENIGFFNDAMRAYGVPPEYLFVTNDLYEQKNMVQVFLGLRALGDKANANGVIPKLKVTKGQPTGTNDLW